MSDIDSSPLLQIRWCDRQQTLINAAINAEEWDNALRLIELGFHKVLTWDDFEFWLSFLWSAQSKALTGLGRMEEAAEVRAKAEGRIN